LSFVSLDTGTIVEYVDLAGTFHSQAKAIFDNIVAGKILGLIAHPILAETYYVSLRVYERLELEKPESRAENLLEWLYRSPNIEIAEPTLKLALTAGKIKREFSVALTDAYVIASSKLYKGKAIFRAREKEIQENIAELGKNYNLVFLEDYSQESEG
jgi:predicted nucleic acid-binding protein